MEAGNHHMLWLVVLLVVMGGCIEEISFDSVRSEFQLVVDGTIHNGPGPYTIHLGITQSDKTVPIPVSNASIELLDSNDNRVVFVEVEPGMYQTNDEDFVGQPGVAYHVEIELPDGRLYYSEPEVMPLQTALSLVSLEPGFKPIQTASGGTREVPVVFVSADTELPENDDPLFLKWSVEGVYAFKETQISGPFAPPAKTCFVSNRISPQEIHLYSGLQSSQEQITNQLLTDERVVPFQVYIRYYYNVVTTSITEERHSYWQNVDEMINQTGTIFDVPPATVTGNIRNRDRNDLPALGYFEAVVSDTIHEFVNRSNFRFNIVDPCGLRNPDRHPACDYCPDIENSTLDKPHYF